MDRLAGGDSTAGAFMAGVLDVTAATRWNSRSGLYEVTARIPLARSWAFLWLKRTLGGRARDGKRCFVWIGPFTPTIKFLRRWGHPGTVRHLEWNVKLMPCCGVLGEPEGMFGVIVCARCKQKWWVEPSTNPDLSWRWVKVKNDVDKRAKRA
jgi:hypothetical protein